MRLFAGALAAASLAMATMAAATIDSAFVQEAAALGNTSAAIADLKAWQPRKTGVLTLRDGDVVGRLGPPGQDDVGLDAIPELTQLAFLAAEDRGFWSNPGIEPAAIVRTAIQNAISDRLPGSERRPSGASTITQQLAKIAFLDGNSGTPRRKIRQAILALRIATGIDKQTVLRLYLNRLYLGHGATGIGEASQAYFDKPPSALTLAESATLAGLADNPNRNDPIAFPERAAKRRHDVLLAMLKDGFIVPETFAEADSTPLLPHPGSRHLVPLATDRIAGIGWAVDLARAEIAARPSDSQPGQGESVAIATDAQLQATTQRALDTGIMKWDAHMRGWRGTISHAAAGHRDLAAPDRLDKIDITEACAGDCPVWTKPAIVVSASKSGLTVQSSTGRWTVPPAGFAWITGDAAKSANLFRSGDIVLAGAPVRESPDWTLVQPTNLQGSAVVLRAGDGAVLAIAGGRDWTPGAFDRALYARRSPGSAFKPFVYLTALNHGFLPSSTVLDEPLTLPGAPGKDWEPEDDDRRFLGPMSLGDALVQSRNAPAIRLALQVGREALSGTAQAFGVYAHIDSPAAAIGARETTNLALTQAYAALANGGMRVQGHIIANLEKSATIQVADPRTLETLTAMLHGVLAEGGTAQTMAPFAERMESRSYRVAGKTGTSSDFKDAWFVGFAGGIAVGVQIGFDQPRTMGTDAFGATVAGPVFAEIVDEAWRIGILKTQEGADEPK